MQWSASRKHRPLVDGFLHGSSCALSSLLIGDGVTHLRGLGLALWPAAGSLVTAGPAACCCPCPPSRSRKRERGGRRDNGMQGAKGVERETEARQRHARRGTRRKKGKTFTIGPPQLDRYYTIRGARAQPQRPQCAITDTDMPVMANADTGGARACVFVLRARDLMSTPPSSA